MLKLEVTAASQADLAAELAKLALVFNTNILTVPSGAETQPLAPAAKPTDPTGTVEEPAKPRGRGRPPKSSKPPVEEKTPLETAIDEQQDPRAEIEQAREEHAAAQPPVPETQTLSTPAAELAPDAYDTQDKVRALLKAVHDKHGMNASLAVMATHNYDRPRDIKPEHFQAIAIAATAKLAEAAA